MLIGSIAACRMTSAFQGGSSPNIKGKIVSHFVKTNLKNANLPAVSARKLLSSAMAVALAVGLVACGGKEKKPGQSVASVNGEEITVLQLNDELARANIPPGQQAPSKQILESLIDRQLLINEAVKAKLDRDPQVMQVIERAKAQILAQTYLQKHLPASVAPTKAEIEEYYGAHPEFFGQRKVFEMRQLILATKDFTPALNAVVDNAKSLDEVAAWLDSNQVKFGRGQIGRSSTDLPSELVKKMLQMNKGQLFIVREGERTILSSLSDIKDAPASLEASAQQIAQFLFNKKNKENADAELARLRSAAKIEYFNKQDAPSSASASASASAAEHSAASAPAETANDRGVAGLK